MSKLRQTMLSLNIVIIIYIGKTKSTSEKGPFFKVSAAIPEGVFIKFCFAAFSFKANVNFDRVNRAEVQLGIIIETLHKKINNLSDISITCTGDQFLVKQFLFFCVLEKLLCPQVLFFFALIQIGAVTKTKTNFKTSITDSLKGWHFEFLSVWSSQFLALLNLLSWKLRVQIHDFTYQHHIYRY